MWDIPVVGESDALALSRNYNCTFVKMVTSWRQKLYDGTNGATDLTFPFGFVQVRLSGQPTSYHFPTCGVAGIHT